MSKGVYVVDTSRSPYALLVPATLDNVKIRDTFWKPRLDLLVKNTLPSQYKFIEETGRLDNFRIASGKKKDNYKGFFWFNDSDVYKWIEASAYAIVYKPSDELKKMIDEVIKEVIDAQQEDGYINTFITINKMERWKELAWSHELYCAGHLFQAAVAVKRALNRTDLYASALKFADLINNTFGPEENKLKLADGHPEVEMALVELYRESGRREYLELADFFINIRGYGKIAKAHSIRLWRFNPEYLVDHKPLKELDDIVGSHAVRALYLFAGATDVYLEKGDRELWHALKRLWTKVISRKMYVTGGFGSRYEGESFGEDYELPNARAYSETCAAVAGILWAWRMFLATGDAKYMDIIEWVLYNAALAGISLDGKRYFYVNPLEDNGKHVRQPWFECACCPPNIARLLAYLPSLIYSVSKDSDKIWINLFVASDVSFKLSNNNVKLSVDTKYPWDGNVTITVFPEKTDEFSIMIRIPEWASGAKVKVGNEEATLSETGKYVEIKRTWNAGDTIKLFIPMKIRFLVSHPLVTNNYAKVAIKRGPLVYCAESIDNHGIDPRELVIDLDSQDLKAEWREDLLGGIVVIRGRGYAQTDKIFGAHLYKDYREIRQNLISSKEIVFTLIPYYAWNNRGANPMAVWIKTRSKYLL